MSTNENTPSGARPRIICRCGANHDPSVWVAKGRAECSRSCSCPPCPPLAELDIPYGDEDGEVAWFLKGERTPTRTAAKKRARYDLDMDLDWIDFRVRTVYMRPSWRSWWGYTPSWGVEKCDRSDPEALPFWEVTHATR